MKRKIWTKGFIPVLLATGCFLAGFFGETKAATVYAEETQVFESELSGESGIEEVIIINETVCAEWSVDPVGAFVDRIYTTMLERDPDANRQDWINKLTSGTYTGAQIVEEFFGSAEFGAKNEKLSNEQFIRILYRTLFGREADEGGLAAWKSNLEEGYIRRYVLAGLANSVEFKNLCNSFDIVPGEVHLTWAESTPGLSDREFNVWQFVERLYVEVLGRYPDKVGMEDWVNKLFNGGWTGATVAEGFIMSQEFLNKNMTHEVFVQTMYRVFFDRDADPTGLFHWTGLLEQGYSKRFVFAGCANSGEFQNVCNGFGITRGDIVLTTAECTPGLSEQEIKVWDFVERLYKEVLGRPADSIGLADWVAPLLTGESTGAQTAGNFIMSAEFMNKTLTNEEYVRIMYKAFFGREADADGLRNLVGAMEQGSTKESVYAFFANSTEFGVLCEQAGIVQGSVDNTPSEDDDAGNTGGDSGNAPEDSDDEVDMPAGTLQQKRMDVGEEIGTRASSLNSYAASVAPLSQFMTASDGYGVACHGDSEITVLLYDKNLQLVKAVTILPDGGEIGAVTCDEYGNFYVVYGFSNLTTEYTKEAIRVVKYASDGSRRQSVSYTGGETGGNGFGTRYPFESANCSAVIQDGVLVVMYGREMFNGHQSSNSLYIDTVTMEKVEGDSCYTSHSFDQQVLAAKDGSILFVDHGDAYERAFTVSKMLPGSMRISGVLDSFHFREGSNRSHGYNETYAQLGGIAEIPEAYVLVGASERTLSLDVAPTDKVYCGSSEPRDLFIQYIRKDYEDYEGAECYAVPGEIRIAVGEKPENALTDLFLPNGVEDYGVIWLTDYEDGYLAGNPKVVTTEAGEVVILWQKVRKENLKAADTYYMMLDGTGTVVQEPVSLGAIPLSANEPAVYLNGSVYWSVTEGTELVTYRLKVLESVISGLEDEISWRIFDETYYLERYPELREMVGTDKVALYSYWLYVGMYNGQSMSPVFVPAEYLYINEDIAEAVEYDFVEATRHFLNQGIYEGRRGSLEFDYAVYVAENRDLANRLGANPVEYYCHYVTDGREEGRIACRPAQGEVCTLGEVKLTPVGKKQFLMPEERSVELIFNEQGQISEMRVWDWKRTLLAEYSYNRSIKNNGELYVGIRHEETLNLVREWNYAADGVLKSQEWDSSQGAFEYAEIVSENGDGTVTIHWFEEEQGRYRQEYFKNGVLSDAYEHRYEDGTVVCRATYVYGKQGECESYSVELYEKEQLIEQTDYEGDGSATYCVRYEYHDNGKHKKISCYFGAEYNPEKIYEYDESGRETRDVLYLYSDSGVYEGYSETKYEYSGNIERCEQVVYDENDIILSKNINEYQDNRRVKAESYRYEDGRCYGYDIYEYVDGRTSSMKSISYDEKGRTLEWEIKEYYENGKLKKEASYIGSGTLYPQYIKEYEADGKNKKGESFRYGSKGELVQYGVTEYANGLVIKELRIDADGNASDHLEYEYYEDGSRKKMANYHSVGTEKPEWIFEYNAKGEKEKEVNYRYSEDGTCDGYKVTYYENGRPAYVEEYDSTGQLIKTSYLY